MHPGNPLTFREELRFKTNALLDQVMPLPVALCLALIVATAEQRSVALLLALLDFGGNLTLNAWIQRARKTYPRRALALAGWVRFTFNMVVCAAMICWSQSPFAVILTFPLVAVLGFYLQRPWSAAGSALLMGVTALTLWVSGAELLNITAVLVLSVSMGLICQTMMRALEAEVVRAQRMEKLQAEYLANTSHEIRTPMAGVLGTLSLLNDAELAPEHRELVEVSHRSAESLLRVLNDVLDAARLEQGHFSVEARAFNVLDALAHLRSEHVALARELGSELRLQVEGELPQFVWGDEARLLQILRNFLTNALKFAPGGPVTLCCRGRDTGDLEFSVTDHGPGIDAADQTRLFTRFARLQPASSAPGTGIGLHIARLLSEAMGGSVGVSSEPGQGATFWLKLPLEVATEPHSAPHSEKPRPEQPPLRLRVLLVDDDATNRMVISRMLRGAGCVVTVARDGAEAIEQYQPGVFDLLLMDCQMPGVDGYEATRRIRALQGGDDDTTPIFAFTASAAPGAASRCQDAGMDGHLTKPLRKRDLLRLLDRVAAGSERAMPSDATGAPEHP